MAEDTGPTLPYTRATRNGSSTTAPAGVILAAADALNSGQQAFTRAQAAYLMRIAYDAGRTARYREDLAELHSTWDGSTWRHKTNEQMVAERLSGYAQAGERINIRLGRPAGYTHPGGPVDWNTGRPVRHLTGVAA